MNLKNIHYLDSDGITILAENLCKNFKKIMEEHKKGKNVDLKIFNHNMYQSAAFLISQNQVIIHLNY